MISVGGEVELAPHKYKQALTNSGRASLRLIIESAGLEDKHILLPDYLCKIIVDVLNEYHIRYTTYKIDLKFGFCLPDDLEKFDALYLIKYFGSKTFSYLEACKSFRGCLIVDDVFSPMPEVLDRNAQWYSFNSLRKISSVSDFSLVYSNSDISPLVVSELQSFSNMKYEAKYKKYNYLHKEIGSEDAYLSLFNSAEAILDSKIGIYKPSADSLIAAINFYSQLEQERLVRLNNYSKVKSLIPDKLIEIESNFYSFSPLILNNRDVVRENLMNERIFLAVHWPNFGVNQNKLSESIISIPLDSRYTAADMIRVCDLILKLDGN